MQARGREQAPIRLLPIGAEERSTLQDVRTAGLHSFNHQKYRQATKIVFLETKSCVDPVRKLCFLFDITSFLLSSFLTTCERATTTLAMLLKVSQSHSNSHQNRRTRIYEREINNSLPSDLSLVCRP